ncbi:glycosyltransferase [Pseudomarimonas arenosa]|uniref:Glycosyltransferase n=1 Tax=Pseudomarimonas arenosa TaxID=2774145 RepID=A0AAW3ZIR6_9GAMM|nr:glycosyltransferase [Pseudomarimonas arenosa]MBD8524897.1 glycosyltransferase [Pseudomarimonas arenosa]
MVHEDSDGPLLRWWLSHVEGRLGFKVEQDVVGPVVLVCVFNAADVVARCLDSLIFARTVPYRVQIIDDGSEPTVAKILREWVDKVEFGSLLRHDQNLGYTAALNSGLAEIRSEFVVILNSDTEVAPGWMEGLLRCALSDRHIGLVGPLSNAASWQSVPEVFDESGSFSKNQVPTTEQLKRWATDLAAESPPTYPRVPLLNGFCLGVKSKVFRAVGTFDQANFPRGYGEENDFCLRAGYAGFQLAVANDVLVSHHKTMSFTTDQRLELSRAADLKLLELHGAARLHSAVAQCRESLPLRRARAWASRIVSPLEVRRTPKFSGRILFVLPASAGGGGVHSVVQEAQAMRRMGVDARLAVPASFLASYLDAYPDIQNLSQWVRPFAQIEELEALTEGVDLIIATVFTSVAMIEQLQQRGICAAFAYYVQDYEPWFYDESEPAWLEAFSSYTRVEFAVLYAKTEWLCAQVASAHSKRVVKVLPSIDHDVYYPNADRVMTGVPVISAMLRPSTPRRGPERTIRVIREIARALGNKLRVLLFGCERHELSDDWADVIESSEFLGQLNRADVAGVLRRSDLFLDLSDYQAFGRTAAEAMACGCVPVVPSAGGTGEYAVDRVNSLVVDVQDEPVCVQRIVEALQAKDSLRAMRARAIAAVAKYTPFAAARSELAAFLLAAKPAEPAGVSIFLADQHVGQHWRGLSSHCSDVVDALSKADLAIASLCGMIDHIDATGALPVPASNGCPPWLLDADPSHPRFAEQWRRLRQSTVAVELVKQHAAGTLVYSEWTRMEAEAIGLTAKVLPLVLSDDWSASMPPTSAGTQPRLLFIVLEGAERSAAAAAMVELGDQLGDVVLALECERPVAWQFEHPFLQPATESDWRELLMCGGPWRAGVVVAETSDGGGGRLELWQMRLAAAGLCPVLPRCPELPLTVQDGVNSILVGDNVPSWFAVLAGLRERSNELQAIGQRAQMEVRDTCFAAHVQSTWKEILREFVARK